MPPSNPAETASSPPTDAPARIAVLARSLADQIAAGEVVERPASVVKELIENSLDAGATRIEIHLEAGGTELIRVIDNGRGIVREDLALALTRHATSKIRDASELLDIGTLGFRGEALASIAAVARVRLRSRTSASDVGYELDSIPGETAEAAPTGMPLGTQVEVYRLFASVPARRKFLRAEATEVGHCSEAVLRAALIHPHVHFVLQHGSRTLVQLSAGTLDTRVEQILVRRGALRPVVVEGEASGVRVRGWLARPDGPSRTRQSISVVVRNRVVSERSLVQIVARSYADVLRDGEQPVACIIVDPPAGTVDVNVHPQKSEVRFSEPQRVYAAVREVLARELASAVRPGDNSSLGSLPHAAAEPGPVGDSGASTPGERHAPAAAALGRWSEAVRHVAAPSADERRSTGSGPSTSMGFRAADESGRGYRLTTRALSGGYGEYKREAAAHVASLRSMGDMASARSPTNTEETGASRAAPLDEATLAAASDVTAEREPTLLGALAGGVVLFEAEGDLLAIDVRTLRTHLVFRRLQASLGGQDAPAQALLSPVVVQRAPEDVQACLEVRDALAALGLCIEGFGDDALIVRAVPAPLRHCVAAEDVTKLLDRVLPWARMHRKAADLDIAQALAHAPGPDPSPRLAKTWLRELLADQIDLATVPGIERWSSSALLRHKS